MKPAKIFIQVCLVLVTSQAGAQQLAANSKNERAINDSGKSNNMNPEPAIFNRGKSCNMYPEQTIYTEVGQAGSSYKIKVSAVEKLPAELSSGADLTNLLLQQELVAYSNPGGEEIAFHLNVPRSGKLICRLYNEKVNLLEQTIIPVDMDGPDLKLSLSHSDAGDFILHIIFNDSESDLRSAFFKIQKIN